MISSVIVDNLNVVCVTGFPPKTDAPLHVDRHAPLAGTITLQLFETIAWWNRQITDSYRGCEHFQFANGDPLDFRRKASRTLASEQLLRLRVRPAPYHGQQRNATRYASSTAVDHR
jgi:hypothetical protein